MSAELKKSTGWGIVLIAFGVAAFFAGARWLAILIPAAILIWYTAMPVVRSGRN